MKHLDKDNLEDFFRESLDRFGDHPSDDLWDKIDAQIPPKPTLLSQVQPWHWLTLGGLVFIGLLAYHFITVGKLSTKIQQKEAIIVEVQSELESLQQQSSTQAKLLNDNAIYQQNLIAQLESSKSQTKKIQAEAKQIVTTQRSIYEKDLIALQTEIAEITKIVTKPSLEAVSSDIAQAETTIKETATVEEPTFSLANTSSTSVSSKATTEGSTPIEKPTLNLSNLGLNTKKPSVFSESLQIKSNAFLNHPVSLPRRTPCDEINQDVTNTDKKDIELLTSTVLIDTDKPNDLPKLLKQRKTIPPTHWWSWSMNGGLHWTNREIRGPVDAAWTSVFNKQETGLVGRELGFGLNYHLGKKWIFSTGMKEQLLEQSIQHDLSIVYKEANLRGTTSQGELSTYNYTVPTSLGDINMALDITNDGYVKSGQTIETKLIGEQKQQAFSFPAIAQFNAINKGNLIIGIKGGFLANYYANGSARFDTPNPLGDGKLHFSRPYDMRAFSGLKKFNLNWTVGAIGMFKVTKEWSVFVEPSVTAGLTPVYFKDNIRTYPFRAGANVGVYYNLYDDTYLEGFKKY